MDTDVKAGIAEMVTEVGEALIGLGDALKKYAKKLNEETKETK